MMDDNSQVIATATKQRLYMLGRGDFKDRLVNPAKDLPDSPYSDSYRINYTNTPVTRISRYDCFDYRLHWIWANILIYVSG